MNQAHAVDDCLRILTDEAGASAMDWEAEENTTKLTNKKEYDCVICSRTDPSSEDKPMGLFVLVQVMVLSVDSHFTRGIDLASMLL